MEVSSDGREAGSRALAFGGSQAGVRGVPSAALAVAATTRLLPCCTVKPASHVMVGGVPPPAHNIVFESGRNGCLLHTLVRVQAGHPAS